MSSTSKPGFTFSAGFAGQLIAGCGAVLTLLAPFGVALPAAGVFCLILGTVIAAPQGRHPGPFMVEWWSVLAVAALVCLIGFGLDFALPVIGSVAMTLGAITALIAVGLGSPVEG